AVLRVDVTHLSADLAELRVVEGSQTNLNGSRVVELCGCREIHVKSLGQRRKALDSLGAVKETWCACNHQVQPGKPTTVDFVYQLPEGVQALLAYIPPHSLQRL